MLSPAGHPRDFLFRRMVALSAGLHVAVAVVGAAWMGLVRPSARLSPVAVVDLVGIGPLAAAQRPAPAAAPASPKAAAPPAPASRSETSRDRKVPPKSSKTPSPERKTSAKTAVLPPPDNRAFSETIRKLRQRHAETERVDEAVSTIRKTMEARAAIGGIREKQARRVDLSALARPPAGPAPGALSGAGGGGTARVSPEDLAYFRALDEKVRSNWTFPSAARGDVQSLMVQVRITIEIDGRVSDIVMEKPSGNSFFDDSVFRAIRKASPLPVPPEKLRGAEDRYEVGFRFFGGEGAS